MNDSPSKSMKHWLVLAVACGMSAGSVGLNMNVIGVFYTPVAESLGIYRGTFAMHATIATIALSIVSLYFPRLIYRFGWKPVLTSGVLIASLATMAMAFTTSVPIFYVLGALRGLGSGLFAMVPLSLIANNWFEEKQGFAMSLTFGFSGIAGAIFSPIFTSLIESIGWEYSFIAMGALLALLTLPAILYPYSLDPKEDGYLPYGYKENAEEQDVVKTDTWDNFSFTNTVFIILLVFALLHTSITGIGQHLPGLAEANQLSPQIGGLMLSAVMVGNITFKLIIGSLSDYLGITKATLIMIVINSVSLLLLLTISNPYVLILTAFVFGSVFSIPSVALPLLTSEFFGRSLYVKIYPVMSFAAGIGGALSMSVVGYVFDFTGSYNPAFIAALAFHLVNIVLLFFVKKKASTTSTP